MEIFGCELYTEKSLPDAEQSAFKEVLISLMMAEKGCLQPVIDLVLLFSVHFI